MTFFVVRATRDDGVEGTLWLELNLSDDAPECILYELCEGYRTTRLTGGLWARAGGQGLGVGLGVGRGLGARVRGRTRRQVQHQGWHQGRGSDLAVPDKPARRRRLTVFLTLKPTLTLTMILTITLADAISHV